MDSCCGSRHLKHTILLLISSLLLAPNNYHCCAFSVASGIFRCLWLTSFFLSAVDEEENFYIWGFSGVSIQLYCIALHGSPLVISGFYFCQTFK